MKQGLSAAAAWAIPSWTWTRGLLRGLGSLKWTFRGYVAPDRCSQERIGFGSDTCQPREFQLQVYPGIRGPCPAADEAAGTQPRPPAARRVLEAGEALQRLVILDGVDAAQEDVPGIGYRPGAGDLGLLEHVALIAIAHVDDRLARGLVLDVHLGALGLRALWVPLQADIGAPVFEGGQRDLGHEIRVAGAGCLDRHELPIDELRWQQHARVGEVVDLTYGGGQELTPIA